MKTRFAVRSHRFMDAYDAYQKGLNGKQAAWAAKQYWARHVLIGKERGGRIDALSHLSLGHLGCEAKKGSAMGCSGVHWEGGGGKCSSSIE